MPLLGNILSGVGTVAGTAIGGPVGGAIGGSLGNLAGRSLRGGRSSGGGSDDGRSRGSRLMQLFEERVERTRAADPTESAVFTSGRGALQEMLRRQEVQDRAALARSGGVGTEQALALRAQRGREGAQQFRGLIGEAGRRQQQERQDALRGLLSAAQLQERRRAREADVEARRRSNIAQLVGTATQAGASIFDTVFSNRNQS